MKSLTDLRIECLRLEGELAVVRYEIAHHPERVRSYFGNRWREEFTVVESVEPIDGWTDSRKNPTHWQGFKFKIGGVEYWVRAGHSWCSDFADCGLYGDKNCHNIHPNDWVDFPGEYQDAKIWDKVGVALLLANGLAG